MIKPTVGRVVWVHRPYFKHDPAQPEAALITYVWNDRMINVGGFMHDGTPFKATSVRLLQDGDMPLDAGKDGTYAEWMPFQKGQAAAQDAAGK
jgi:hypothetical protein